MDEVVRHVIIKAETRYVGEKRPGSVQGSSSSSGMAPLGDRNHRRDTQQGRERLENSKKMERSGVRRVATQKELLRLDDAQILRKRELERREKRVVAVEADTEAKQRQQLRILRKINLEKQSIDNAAKAAQNQAKQSLENEKRVTAELERQAFIRGEMAQIKHNSLAYERQLNRDMMPVDKAPNGMSINEYLAKRYAEREIQYRKDTGQSVTIGNNPDREEFKDSRDNNPFSTGIKELDAFNAKGFQLFITMMSARMVAELTKVGATNLYGLATGEGDSYLGKSRRELGGFYNTNRMNSEGGFFSGLMDYSHGTLKFMDSLTSWFMPEGKGMFERAGMTSSAYNQFDPNAPTRTVEARSITERYQEGFERAVGPLEQTFAAINDAERRLHEIKHRDEMKALQERRSLFMEERAVAQQRVSGERGELQQAHDAYKSAVLAYGSLDAEQQAMARVVADALRQGTFQNLPKNIQDFGVSQTALFGQDIERLTLNRAFQSGFKDIDSDLQFRQGITREEGELQQARKTLTQAQQEVISIEASIEKLEFKVDPEKMAKQIEEFVVPELEKMIAGLKKELLSMLDKKRQDEKAGRDIF